MEVLVVPRTSTDSRPTPGSRSNAIGSLGLKALAAAFLAMVVVVLVQAAPASAKVTPGPPGLAFYEPPQTLPDGPHGTAIWARGAGGLVPLANGASTKLVLYKSTTPQGNPTAVSGSITVPKGTPPTGGWPVITYAHGTTGTADICAPSRVHAGAPAESYITYVDPQLNAWVRAGYAVVRTDYQGLGTPGPHPYLIGKSEGRSVLDIVRAARQVNPSIGDRFLIAGHSQGGHAALFAAGEAKSWTPDLTLRGTVAYAPASHLLEQAKLLPNLTTPSPLTALATLIVQGASTSSSYVNPGAILSQEALQFYPLVDQTCLSQLAQPRRLGGIAPADLPRSGANLNPLYNVLEKQNPDVATSAPVYIAQGSADTTVFPFYTQQLSTQLTDAGDKVSYVVYQGVDHGAIVAAAESNVLPWFEKRLPAGG